MEKLVSWIAPHNCVVCDVEGSLLCEGCLNAELTEVLGRCYRCHEVSPVQSVCPSCRRLVSLRHVWVASDYDEVAKKLIYKLKFERATAAARPIAEKISQILPNLPDNTVVCHIPTAASRVRIRGYDQAAEIAKCLAESKGYAHKTLLNRTGKTRQVGTGRVDRFKQLENAFTVRPFQDLTNILLIDDITTTGATIEAAGKILRKAGAKTIDVAVFAQA